MSSGVRVIGSSHRLKDTFWENCESLLILVKSTRVGDHTKWYTFTSEVNWKALQRLTAHMFKNVFSYTNLEITKNQVDWLHSSKELPATSDWFFHAATYFILPLNEQSSQHTIFISKQSILLAAGFDELGQSSVHWIAELNKEKPYCFEVISVTLTPFGRLSYLSIVFILLPLNHNYNASYVKALKIFVDLRRYRCLIIMPIFF